MASRIRRLSRTAKKKGPTEAQLNAQRDRLQSIASMMVTIEAMQKDLAAAETELFMFMTDNGLEHLDVPRAVADITQSSGKSVNIVDPKALRTLLKKDSDFYSCISVSITKVKELVAGKELDKITTTIPATPGPRKLKVKLIEEK